MVALFDTAAVKAEMKELGAKGKALIELAASEDRDLTPDEETALNEIHAKLGAPAEGDEPATGLYAELARAEKLSAMASQFSQVADPNTRPNTPGVPAVHDSTPAQSIYASIRVPEQIAPARHGLFGSADGPQRAYASFQWLKASLFNDREAQAFCDDFGIIYAQQTIGTDSAGGYTVPKPLASQILDVIERSGVSRQTAMIEPMGANTHDWPKRVSGPAVTYPAEASAISETNQSWDQVNLVATKRAILTKVSTELREDSIIDFMSKLAFDMGREFARQEDNEYINGDGTGTYGGETGLLATLDATGKNTGSGNSWDALTLADFNDTMALVHDKFFDGSNVCWLVSRAFYNGVMSKLLYAAGGTTPAAIAMGTSTDGPSTLIGEFMGYPVYGTEWMPRVTGATQTCALFGNFRESALVGDRRLLQIMQSEHFAFNEDVVTMRGTRRYDINVHRNGASGDGYAGLVTAT